MEITVKLHVDEKEVYRHLGFGNVTPSEPDVANIKKAIVLLEESVRVRFNYARFSLHENEKGEAAMKGLSLSFSAIQKHLAGCGECILMGVSLGKQTDMLVRSVQALDMARAVLIDAAASVLIDQYADFIEEGIRQDLQKEALFLTGRFSPGYGDFPLSVQNDILWLISAEKQIGIGQTKDGMLIPAKSITAVMGISKTDKKGYLAACDDCSMKERCQRRKEGVLCGKIL